VMSERSPTSQSIQVQHPVAGYGEKNQVEGSELHGKGQGTYKLGCLFDCLWKEAEEYVKEGLQTMQRKLCARCPPTPTTCLLLFAYSLISILSFVIIIHSFLTLTQPTLSPIKSK
jgi:hypothetical protein